MAQTKTPRRRAAAAVDAEGAPDGTTVTTAPSEDGQPRVGDNLRLLRAERGYSLAELAARSGVSRAMLNQIENGRSSPTIAIGWKIANGLGVPFGALLGEAQPGDFVLRRSEQLSEFYSQGRALRSRALFPAGERRAAELYELTLAPGGEERARGHVPGTREQIVLLDGALSLECSGQRAELAAGDLLFFRADRPHRYHNPGAVPARFLLVMCYPAGQAPQAGTPGEGA